MRRKRLDKQFSEILPTLSAEKRILAGDLLREMQFLSGTMAELKKKIAENGVTENFTQGKDTYERMTPAYSAYLQSIAKYASLSAKVAALLPKSESDKKETNPLDAFLASYNDTPVATECHQ